MDASLFPEDVVAVGDSLIRFVEQEVVPLEVANKALLASERTVYDEEGRFVPDVLALRRKVRMRSAEQGFYTMLSPEELGGAGLGPLATVYLSAKLAAFSGPDRLLVHTVVVPSPFTNGLSPLLTFLEPETRARLLPGFASGEKTLCFALSEPDAGSDVMAMKARAVRDGDNWLISGTKQWITNGPYADYVMVFAVTNPQLAESRKGGITGFLVDTRSDGFSVSSTIPIMGHQGAEIGILNFDNVRVADTFRLGDVDAGLKVAMHGVNTGRLGLSATCVGLARWALNQALDYARTRKAFGKTIGEHQSVQTLLADCATDLYGAETMLVDCARRLEQGQTAQAEISMIKVRCTEAANQIFDRCIQVHGAMGLTNELRLEAGYRFTRSMRIPDGTSEIQRRTIARNLLGNGITF